MDVLNAIDEVGLLLFGRVLEYAFAEKLLVLDFYLLLERLEVGLLDLLLLYLLLRQLHVYLGYFTATLLVRF